MNTKKNKKTSKSKAAALLGCVRSDSGVKIGMEEKQKCSKGQHTQLEMMWTKIRCLVSHTHKRTMASQNLYTKEWWLSLKKQWRVSDSVILLAPEGLQSWEPHVIISLQGLSLPSTKKNKKNKNIDYSFTPNFAALFMMLLKPRASGLHQCWESTFLNSQTTSGENGW